MTDDKKDKEVLWIPIGIALGLGVGSLLGNMMNGMLLGLGVGGIIVLVKHHRRKRSHDRE